MGTWYTSFKGLGMRNLQYETRICQKKVIVRSQRQFIYGSNLYESDVTTKSSNLEKMFDVYFGSEGQI